jgi:hypothetical protein
MRLLRQGRIIFFEQQLYHLARLAVWRCSTSLGLPRGGCRNRSRRKRLCVESNAAPSHIASAI